MFQASIIHVYNCTSSNPEVAMTSREYVKICIEDCIEPMGREMTNAPQHAIPLIRTLMELIDADKTGGSKSPLTPPFNNTNLNPPVQPVQQPSPMSVHAIVDWGTAPTHPVQEPFVPNNVSTAAWQQLFSSAATPFFESDLDWQGKNDT